MLDTKKARKCHFYQTKYQKQILLFWCFMIYDAYSNGLTSNLNG